MSRKFFKLITILGLILSGLLPAASVSAAGASISLVANKGTMPSGGSLIVAVYMNGGGTPINAVQADIAYPASKLQYVGFSASGSAFEIGASSGGGDGLASLARGTTGSVSGSGLVGTVTFRALAGSGSAALGVASSSSLVRDGNPVPYYPAGTSVKFGAVAAAASGAPAAPAPPKDTSPPTITAIKPKDVTPFSATITWTTSEGADSVVEYGLDSSYGLSASASPAVTAHVINLSSAFLTPETLLHYRVKSTDGSGNATASPDQTLQLPGVPVTIIVRGADGKPQAGATVTLDNQTGTTDSQGRVTLPSSLGNKKITTTYQGVTVQKPITVAKTAKPLPPYQLDLAKQPLNHWMLLSIGLTVAVLTLLGIDAVLFGSHFFGRLAGLHFPALRHQAAVAAPPAPEQPSNKTNITTMAEPPVDATKTIAELMGGPPPIPAEPPIEPKPVAAPTPAPTPQATPPIVAVSQPPVRPTEPIHITVNEVAEKPLLEHAANEVAPRPKKKSTPARKTPRRKHSSSSK